MAITIDGKTYRNQQEQIYKNMEDIQELQNTIKPEYTTAEALTSSSTSVAIANTNAPSGTKSGWLLTQDGLKFKITGGDDTNLLLEYYANLKGPQGESGAALNIDDNSVSQTKVWSSYQTKGYTDSKIDDAAGTDFTTWSSNKINRLISSGIAWTTTSPDGDDQIAKSNIYLGGTAANNTQIGGPKLKVDDLIVYVDGDLKAKTLYRVASIVGSTATVAKVCDFAQGKQLYQHNIRLWKEGTRYVDNVYVDPIINNSPNEMDFDDLLAFLIAKGYNYDNSITQWYLQNFFPIKGTSYDKNTNTVNNYYKGVNVLSPTTINFWTEKGHGEWTSETIENFEDNVFPL